MPENLEIIFNCVLEKAHKLRKANPTKFDGLGFWQPIKKMLEPLDKYSAKKWKTIPQKITNHIMLLPEYTINGYEEKIIIENNHFIIQQVRIPLKEVPTIRKIVQIALNIGQYRGSGGKMIFDNIGDFITKKDIMELSKYIPDDLVARINSYLKVL